jgi:hypothetical protein
VHAGRLLAYPLYSTVSSLYSRSEIKELEKLVRRIKTREAKKTDA